MKRVIAERAGGPEVLRLIVIAVDKSINTHERRLEVFPI